MEAQIDPRLLEIASQLAEVASGNGRIADLEERLDLADRQILQLRLEDEGWQLLSGGKPDGDTGPVLSQVKEMSGFIRAAVAESPLPKQANSLRASYTFSERFLIPNLDGSTESPESTSRRGPKTGAEKGLAALRSFATARTAREYVFGKSAQSLISTACSTDGVYLLLGDDKSKEVHALSIQSITDIMVDPDHPGEVWAYLREWTPDPGKPESTKARWYYTDRYPGKREARIGTGQDAVTVDKDKTVIDLSVNNQTDWALGVPDLWAGHVWNRNYLAAVKDGMEVSSLMAWLSAKVKNQSQSGANKTGVVVGGAGRGAGVQTYGEGNAIDTYSTTGKAYEYQALNPVAALYALAAGVSLVDLLSSPAASGSSYGAAQALTGGLRRAIELRRDIIAAWMERVLEWATGTYVPVTPAPIIEADERYRRGQTVIMGWNTGLFHADEVRSEVAYVAGVTLKHAKAPDGVLLPNNKESLARKDIDTDSGDGGVPPTAASPDQGQDNGAGGSLSTDKNDIRTDLN